MRIANEFTIYRSIKENVNKRENVYINRYIGQMINKPLIMPIVSKKRYEVVIDKNVRFREM